VLIINLSIEGHVAVNHNDILRKNENVFVIYQIGDAAVISSLSLSLARFFSDFISNDFYINLILHTYDL